MIKNLEKLKEQDVEVIDKQKVETRKQIKQLKDNFEKYFQERQKYWVDQREERVKMLGYDEDELTQDSVTIEIVDKKEEIEKLIISKADE